MDKLRIFLDNLKEHNKEKGILFNQKRISYLYLLNKSYDLARLLESYGYRKIFSNLKNSPLSISLYIASFISDIDFFVPINPRLINSELEIIIENGSLFITDQSYDLELEFSEILYIKDDLEFLSNLPQTDNYEIFANTIISHISSGSTGFYQKHNHNINQIIEYAQNIFYYIGLKKDDNLLICLSINHAFAFSYQLLPALVMGLNITLISEFEPKLFAKIINESNVTALALLPTMYHFLIKENISKNHNLRYLGVAGDFISDSLNNEVKEKLGIPLLNGIGMTEVFGYGQNISYQESNTIKIFADTDVKIEKLETNNYGKIFIKNNILPLNNKNEWLETGDIGSFDKQKYQLTFYGRYKDIIIKGGSNISPVELENHILKIKGIKSCVIVGKYDKIWGETIWAFLVSYKEYVLDHLNIKLSKYVSKYKNLDGVIYMDKIPITLTGKIDRNKLKELINNEC